MDLSQAKKRVKVINMVVERAETLGRLPKKEDFSGDEIKAIKCEYGSMPRAMEAAGLKPVSRSWVNKQKRKKARRSSRSKAKDKLFMKEDHGVYR